MPKAKKKSLKPDTYLFLKNLIKAVEIKKNILKAQANLPLWEKKRVSKSVENLSHGYCPDCYALGLTKIREQRSSKTNYEISNLFPLFGFK